MPDVQPIPASHYGQAYFDGQTSNYTQGYSWELYGGLFELLARLLTGMFPAAHDYLDVGCATGLLIRSLREQGKAAWGIEHSDYCLEHAEALARPYILHESMEYCVPLQSFDVVTACETLEHLTPRQILATLHNLRTCTRVALFATIPTPDMAHRAAWRLAQKEPSHITLEPRSWWYEQFEAAGFVHDVWQEIAELYCREHPVVKSVGWDVFVLGVTP